MCNTAAIDVNRDATHDAPRGIQPDAARARSLVGEDLWGIVRRRHHDDRVGADAGRDAGVRAGHDVCDVLIRRPDVQNLLAPLVQGVATGLHHS